MRIQAVNAAAYTQSNTQITGMRITAVRDCFARFMVFGKGTDAAGPNITTQICRGITDGTPGSAITATKLRSSASDTVTNLATFLDKFGTASTFDATKCIDTFCFHPQFNGYSDWHELLVSEKLDLFTVADASASGKILIRCIVQDRN